MWTEVFRTGSQTASNGMTVNITQEHLDRIIRQYNPAWHEAPVVIGHPEYNAPAFGWVEALKREGNVLFAKLKDLVPEFLEMVEKGLFKKRSISLYPDFSIRHVGFLGAMPPAVKGLANIKFKEGGTTMSKEINFTFDAEGNDPGEELRKKTIEWLKNPPRYDSQGNRLPAAPSFGEVFNAVCRENPELAQKYVKQLGVIRDSNSPFYKTL